jgi:hypothetical protein
MKVEMGRAAVLPFDGTRLVGCELPHGGTMSLQSRLESLSHRHASLEMKISDEDHRPRPDDSALARLKVEKLRVKEEMERLRRS